MSRIFLHPNEQHFGSSIRILAGQICTVGSSSAADHCLRAAGVETMHCRIGCRAQAGFLECINDMDTVIVNGTPRNRARLNHNDVVRIGIVEMRVEVPGQTPKQSYIVSDDRPSNTVTPAPEGSIDPPPGDSLDQPISSTNDNKRVFDFFDDSLSESEMSTVSAPASSEPTPEPKPPTPPIIAETATEPEESVTPDLPDNNDAEGSVFEFDSTEADKIPLTAEDLDAVKNRSSETITVEDAVRLSETTDEQNPIDNQSTNASEQSEPTDSGRSEERIPGGSPQASKFWRWSGSTAVLETIAALQHHANSFACYQVADHAELVEFSFERLNQELESQSSDQIYLITDKDPADVSRILISKRWHERMRHPEALNMSISILPARHVAALFEQVDTIVLAQKGGIDLIRIDNQRTSN